MKREPVNKAVTATASEPARASNEASASSEAGGASKTVGRVVDAAKSAGGAADPVVTEYPPPDLLEAEAESETNRRRLSDYSRTIWLLREKGFTFREISDWLAKRGVEADHNAVYRVYTKGMDDSAKADVVRELEQEEEEG